MFKKLGELQKKFTDKINNLQFPRPETMIFQNVKINIALIFPEKEKQILYWLNKAILLAVAFVY